MKRFSLIFLATIFLSLVSYSQALAAPPPANYRLLVIPFVFNDSGAPWLNHEQIVERVFAGQFQNFYHEQSYGKIDFSGDVTELITINSSQPPGGVCGSVDLVTPEINSYLVNHNIDLNNYEGLVYMLNLNTSHSGCAFVGRGPHYFQNEWYMLSMSWIQGQEQPRSIFLPFSFSQLDGVLSHEIGHNLGLWHANSLDCHEQSLAESGCDHVEYGNHYDVMGFGQLSLHFNAVYKSFLGWITPAQILQINFSGVYTIHPLESATNQVKLAVVETEGGLPFYLEYRRAIGFDASLNNSLLASNQNGLFISRDAPDNLGVVDSQVFDMQPTTADWYIDSSNTTLNGTNTFTWGNVTIGPILSNDANGITFRVTYNGPTFQNWPLY